jgi:uracil-DNA glycosylase family 4
LTNAVVCRPTEESGINRIPTLTELENCSERIEVFVETLKPKAVCLVGAVARDFYGKKLLEWKYMGQVWLIHHPAYILRLGGDTSQAYQDWVDSIRDVLSSTR